MATLRKELEKAGFDWGSGVIIWHETPAGRDPGWSRAVSRERISPQDPILDREFDPGFGGPEMPRFFARDGEKVYFPSQYDGATSVVAAHVDPDHYLLPGSETPYPGGG